MNFSLETHSLSDTGKIRSNNEDRCAAFSGNYGHLFIVCDGIGGHSGGEIASELAVEAIKKHFNSLDGIINEESELRKSIINANEIILDAAKSNPLLFEMGSTITMLLIKENKAYTANLGDSRIYFSRDGKIIQLTKDHTLVQQLIDKGIIKAKDAKKHPKRNIITRSLGIDKKTNPDTNGPIEIKTNDCFVLCSDGLTNHVGDEEINKIISASNAQEACKELIKLANERGGEDNITVQIVKIHSST
jgi:PPM family protein phosphatase